MVMLGSTKDTDYGRLVKPPRDAGISTQSIYLVVADADAHHTRAKAAGAEIVIDLVTQDYGGRDYTCRDPEGHIWTFGTYDPWAEQNQRARRASHQRRRGWIVTQGGSISTLPPCRRTSAAMQCTSGCGRTVKKRTGT